VTGSADRRPDSALSAIDFAALVEERGASLLRFLRRMVGDADLAEDLLQDVLVSAYHHRGDARPESVRAWLYAIAVNRARNALRDRRRVVTGAQGVEEEADTLTIPPPSPEAALLRRELRAEVLQAIGDLPPDGREAVLLRDMEALTYREIAQVTGISEGAARVRVYRARERLREALRPYVTGEDRKSEDS
jgi:RNA polymerase sigma-70 factor (ECF subfamily)